MSFLKDRVFYAFLFMVTLCSGFGFWRGYSFANQIKYKTQKCQPPEIRGMVYEGYFRGPVRCNPLTGTIDWEFFVNGATQTIGLNR